MKKHNYQIISSNNYNCKIIYITEIFFQQEIFALIKRFIIQALRRPLTVTSSIIQSFLWLILFGALFQDAPVGLFTSNIKYGNFLSSGIIIFTAFTGSLNAGLPIIFDREFGFLNRLLVSPLISRESILVSSSVSTIIVTILQTLTIMLCSFVLFECHLSYTRFFVAIMLILLLSIAISSLSIGLSFALPGHIEFLACNLIINLPILFSSTALAPLSFMPYWLQIIASINPLTYAIESIRFLSFNQKNILQTNSIKIICGYLQIHEILFLFTALAALSFILIKKFISDRYE